MSNPTKKELLELEAQSKKKQIAQERLSTLLRRSRQRIYFYLNRRTDKGKTYYLSAYVAPESEYGRIVKVNDLIETIGLAPLHKDGLAVRPKALDPGTHLAYQVSLALYNDPNKLRHDWL